MRTAVVMASVLACGVAEAAAPPAARVDFLGDPLPRGAVVRMGSARWHHPDGCHGVGFSPTGDPVSWGWGWVYVWDARTGKARRQLPTTKAGSALPPQWSKDGKLLLARNEAGCALYEAATGKFVGPADAPWERGLAALSPDGEAVAVAAPGGVRLVETATGRESKALKGSSGLYDLAFSPDGKWLAASQRLARDKVASVTLWDVESGEARRLPTQSWWAWKMEFSPDSAVLAVGDSSRRLAFWDVAKGVRLPHLGLDESNLLFAFVPGGKAVALTKYDGKEVRFHSLATGEIERRTPLPPGSGRIGVSPCGKQLVTTSSQGQRIALCEAGTGKRLDPSPAAHEKWVWGHAASPDGALLASADDAGNFVFWDANTGRQMRRAFVPKGDVIRHQLQFGDGGKSLAFADTPLEEARGERPSVIRFLDAGTGKEVRTRIEMGCETSGVAFARGGHTLATIANHQEPRLWDARTGKQLPKLLAPYPAKFRNCVALSDDAGTLLVASDHQRDERRDESFVIQSWDLPAPRRQPRTWKVPGRGLAMCFLRECDRTAFVLGDAQGWSLDTKRSAQNRKVTVAEEVRRSRGVASPDGKLVVTPGEHPYPSDVYVWEAATGRIVAEFNGDGRPLGTPFRGRSRVSSPSFSADAKRVYTVGPGNIILGWDLLALLGDRQVGDRLGAEEIAREWELLAGEDAAAAYAAVARLSRSPREVVPFLRKHLPPIPLRDTKRIRAAIAKLDDDDFDVRKAAFAQLERLAAAAEPELDEAARNEQTDEARTQVARLLEKLQRQPRPPYPLRQSRAVHLLSWMGTPDATASLVELSNGDPDAPLTRDARQVLRGRPDLQKGTKGRRE